MNEIQMTQTGANREGSRSSFGILLTLSLSVLLSSLGASSANVALPTLAQHFQISFQAAQWIVVSYLLAMTTLIVSAGKLGDIAGRRQLLLVGILVFVAASFLCAVAPVFWFLVAVRAAQGLGAAIMMALALALAGESATKGKTGSVMGLLGTMSAVGTALGPSLGGVLVSTFGWRGVFWFNVPVSILTFLLALRFLPTGQLKPTRTAFDFAGAFFLAFALAAYALAMTMGRGHFGLLNIGLLLASALGLVLFAIAESKAAAPLIKLELFRDPKLRGNLAMSMIVATVMMATLVVGTFYLSLGLQLKAAFVGGVMSIGPLVAALSGVPSGRAVDRFGFQRMTLFGLVGMGSGAALLSVLPTSLGIFGYITPIVITTAGYALFQAANNTAIMHEVAPEQRGVISAVLNLSRNLGLLTGATLMGAVFAWSAGTPTIITADAQAVASGTRSTFAVATSLIIAALAISSRTRSLMVCHVLARKS